MMYLMVIAAGGGLLSGGVFVYAGLKTLAYSRERRATYCFLGLFFIVNGSGFLSFALAELMPGMIRTDLFDVAKFLLPLSALVWMIGMGMFVHRRMRGYPL